ncbi:hypothetical protein CYMTET_12976 [Cymbomonas tetramitiformis]|uniref:Uncharacterized protein n=1 Tax=Cymbomonas tetramitiformis TaxID=36881 RepID=A0AAE0LBV8_9CHLO|nr:hypothetical protein CYMTET_12976 [Cymbomonas tetramitiformis]|eukprot:gene14984-17713_t
MPAVPRLISETEGARAHVQLGTIEGAKASWLLIYDRHDGCSEWQEYHWDRIPAGLASRLKECSAKNLHVNVAAYGSNPGEWYVSGVSRDSTGTHSWWGGSCSEALDRGQTLRCVSFGSPPSELNWEEAEQRWVTVSDRNGYNLRGVDSGLIVRLKRLNSRGKEIHNICLSQHSPLGYFIRDEEGMEWNGLGEHLTAELRRNCQDEVLHICESPSGEWLIVRGSSFQASDGAPKELQKALTHLFSSQREDRLRRVREINAAKISNAVDRTRDEAEAEEARRKEYVRQEQMRALRQALQDRSVEFALLARSFARQHDYVENHTSEENCVACFCRRTSRDRIVVYFSTRTVSVSCLSHPDRGTKKQLLLRSVSPELLDTVFREPRALAAMGYNSRPRYGPSIGPLGFSRIDSESEQAAAPSEEDAIVEHLFSLSEFASESRDTCHDGDACFAHLLALGAQAWNARTSVQAAVGGFDLASGEIVCRRVVLDVDRRMGFQSMPESRERYVVVQSVFASSPAEKADIRPLDQFISMQVQVQGAHALPLLFSGPSPCRLGLLRKGCRVDATVFKGEDGSLGVMPLGDPVGSGPIAVTPYPGSTAAYSGVESGDLLENITVAVYEHSTFNSIENALPPFTTIMVALLRPTPLHAAPLPKSSPKLKSKHK